MKKTEDIKAVLVRLSIRIFPNSRQDPNTTEEVLLKKALGKGAGKWVKYLLPESAFTAVREAGGDFRRRHYDITLPWEEGYRLLPATGHAAYEAEFNSAKEKFEKVLAEFGHRYANSFTVDATSAEATEYAALVESVIKSTIHAAKKEHAKTGKGKAPDFEEMREKLAKKLTAKHIGQTSVELPSLVEQAKLMHNGTFDESLYPEWRFMKNNFSFGMAFTPMPKAAHFIASGFASEAVAEMKTELQKANEARVQLAVKDTYNRLMKPIQDIAEKLTGSKPIFRDTIIQNVKDVLALIPQLNLTGDEKLMKLAKTIEDKFATINPNLLREDKAVRLETASVAKKLISTFGAIGKRRFA